MLYYPFIILKFIIAWLDLVLFTAIMYLLSFLPKILTKKYYQTWFSMWSRCFARAIGLQLHLHQKNLKPIPESCLIIGNHPSIVEDIGVPCFFPGSYVAKIEVKDWWFAGRISQAAGCIYVHRENKDSRAKTYEAIVKGLNEGKRILVYPEGGCKGRRLHLPFLYGPFRAAMEANKPIVPIFLHYEAQEAFEWDKQPVLKKIWQVMLSPNHHANYYVYDAIYPSQFASKEEFCDYVQNFYLKLQSKYLE